MAVNTIKLTSVVMDGECVRMTDHTGLNLDLILTPQTDQYTEHRHTTLFYRYWPTTGLKKCILGFFFQLGWRSVASLVVYIIAGEVFKYVQAM